VATLTRIANDASAPAAARVSASTAMLKFSRESIDLAERVAAIEQQVASHQTGGVAADEPLALFPRIQGREGHERGLSRVRI
jgi:hypothetical protein